MKKLFLAKIFIFALACSVFSQEDEPWEPTVLMSNRVGENLTKAKVKVEQMYVFEVDNQGNVAKKGKLRNETRYNRQGKNIKSSTFMHGFALVNISEYDKEGKPLRTIVLDGDGNIQQFIEYEYAWDGGFVGTHYRSPNGESTFSRPVKKSLGDTTLIYTAAGKLDSKSISTYDSISKVYCSRLLNLDNEMMYENRYQLNEQLQILEWSVVDKYQGRQTITKFKYDSNGNKIEEVEYDKTGKVNHRFVNEYNKKNLKVKSTMFKPEGTVYQVFAYKYQYFNN